MLEPGIDDFFDTVKFGAPEVAHVVEAPVEGVEALIDCAEALVQASCHAFEFGIYVGHQQADEDGVEEHRSADDKVELFVGQLVVTSTY